MKRVITFGTFDLFHYGHLMILERAANLGDELFVGISSDELNETVNARLRSIGVVSGKGDCAMKNLALVQMRKMFESSNVSRF